MKKDERRENDIQKLKWAIWLSRKGDLTQLGEGDLIKLKHDLWEFVDEVSLLQGNKIEHRRRPLIFDSKGELESLTTKEAFLEIDQELISVIQDTFVDLFTRIAKREINGFMTDMNDAALYLHVDSHSHQFIPVFATVSIMDSVRVALTFHLHGAGITADDVKICSRSNCKGLFLRERKEQIYCDIKCGRAVASAKHYKNTVEQSRSKERKRGRVRYKAKFRPGTPIGKTRPRIAD